MAKRKLKAPFPYFGGKSRIAAAVWERFGNVPNYIEPFCGSAAMLLLRPHAPRVETINDADCYVSNFWRATQHDPEAVAAAADWPVNEADLHSRHRWLVLSNDAAAFREKMRSDPDYFDAKIAGLWCWGLCCWIGGGWCAVGADGGFAYRNGRNEAPIHLGDCGANGINGKPRQRIPDISGQDGACGRGIHASAGPRNKRPQQCGNGFTSGIHAKRPSIGDRTSGNGVNGPQHRRPQLGGRSASDAGQGVHLPTASNSCDERRGWILEWFGELRDRLREVRVCCGDWLRVCNSPSVTTRLGVTGVFFDPPYSAEAGRDMELYGTECGKVAHDVRAYCIERGADPKMRIALCGYEGEHEALEQHGWEVIVWRATGGYGNRSAKGKANASRERIWFSPHCLSEKDVLF